MKTHLLLGGGTVKAEVVAGDLIFEGTDHMITVFSKLRDKRLKKIKVFLAGGIELKIKRTDGWEIVIKEEAGNSQNLVITRHPVDDDQGKRRQYLSIRMNWLYYPKAAAALPSDALRIPLFAP